MPVMKKDEIIAEPDMIAAAKNINGIPAELPAINSEKRKTAAKIEMPTNAIFPDALAGALRLPIDCVLLNMISVNYQMRFDIRRNEICQEAHHSCHRKISFELSGISDYVLYNQLQRLGAKTNKCHRFS